MCIKANKNLPADNDDIITISSPDFNSVRKNQYSYRRTTQRRLKIPEVVSWKWNSRILIGAFCSRQQNPYESDCLYRVYEKTCDLCGTLRSLKNFLGYFFAVKCLQQRVLKIVRVVHFCYMENGSWKRNLPSIQQLKIFPWSYNCHVYLEVRSIARSLTHWELTIVFGVYMQPK